MVQISINVPKEMRDEIDEKVANSNLYESRSHYFRVAHRELQDSDASPRQL